jgi:hypothetical protein
MSKAIVFVGSSSEAEAQAKSLIRDLSSPMIEFLPWWDAFTPGHLLLSDLAEVKKNATAALLLFTPDIPAKVRGSKVTLPNQNVLFELGYFFSAFDASRIALIRCGATHIPKDLDGYTHVLGSKFFKPGAAVPAGKKTREQFGKWVAQLVQEHQGLVQKNEVLGGQLQDQRARESVDEQGRTVLEWLFREGQPMAVEEIADGIGYAKGVTDYHCEFLRESGFLERVRFHGAQRRIGMGEPDWGYGLTQKGRQWIMQESHQ